MIGTRWRARPRPTGSEDGASAVEFALVVPVLLLVVFGVINFGMVMTQKAALSNSVRAAARYATVNAYSGTHTCQSVIDRARSAAKTLGISDSNKNQVAVTVKFTNNTTNATTTVCAASAGSASATTGNGAAMPCQNVNGTPATPDQLTIEETFASSLLVATPGLGKTVSLSSSASFLCEYYQ